MFYLEDLNEGREFKLGSIEVTKKGIIDFATQFDPQEFHLKEDVAKKMFGGLIASGWHTASLCMRLTVDGFLHSVACMVSPGVDELRFVKPVFVGDILTGKITVISTSKSHKKPDRGLAKLLMEMYNAENKLVLSMIGNVIINCRS